MFLISDPASAFSTDTFTARSGFLGCIVWWKEQMTISINKTVENSFTSKLGLHNIVVNNCFRGGTTTNRKIRPIIVNVENLQHRNLVYFNKKKLIGTKIVITEEPVKSTYKLLLFAKAIWVKIGSGQLKVKLFAN